MSHHYSGPNFGFPYGDARLDFTDLYAFLKPGDGAKSILIMNVHPSTSENPPGLTTAEPFAPEALYELKIDTDGDAIADIAYRVRFTTGQGGTQNAILRRIDGPQAADTGDGGLVIVERAPVSTGPEARVTEAGDYRFFAGWRSDPFFCDVEGTKNNLQFTGDDFFADKDVCSIALEVPNSALGSKIFACGPAPWFLGTAGKEAGFRWTAERCLLKRTSSLARKKVRTSPVRRPMTRVSCLCSRTRLSTQVVIRSRKQNGWLAHCYQIFFPMTRRARRPIPLMAELSPRMFSTSSWPSSQMERLQRIK